MSSNRRPLPTALRSGLPGCYRLRAPVTPGDVMSPAVTVYHADAAGLTSRATLVAAVGSVLACPVPVTNWDALLDVLRDLSWLPSRPSPALLITGLAALGKADAGAVRTFERIVLDAAAFWARHPGRAPLFILELPSRPVSPHASSLPADP